MIWSVSYVVCCTGTRLPVALLFYDHIHILLFDDFSTKLVAIFSASVYTISNKSIVSDRFRQLEPD